MGEDSRARAVVMRDLAVVREREVWRLVLGPGESGWWQK